MHFTNYHSIYIAQNNSRTKDIFQRKTVCQGIFKFVWKKYLSEGLVTWKQRLLKTVHYFTMSRQFLLSNLNSVLTVCHQMFQKLFCTLHLPSSFCLHVYTIATCDYYWKLIYDFNKKPWCMLIIWHQKRFLSDLLCYKRSSKKWLK